MTITVYTRSTPRCVQCTGVKMWLDARGIPFIERDISTDPEAIAEVEATGIRSLPVVVADGCAPFGGYVPHLLVEAEQAQEAETRAVERDSDGWTIKDSRGDGNAVSGENNHGGQWT